jgi:hypothetical protein
MDDGYPESLGIFNLGRRTKAREPLKRKESITNDRIKERKMKVSQKWPQGDVTWKVTQIRTRCQVVAGKELTRVTFVLLVTIYRNSAQILDDRIKISQARLWS